MKELNQKQKLLVIFLCGLIILCLGMMFLIPQLFSGHLTITYQGGCQENYIGMNLTEDSDNCFIERAIQNYYIKKINKSRYFFLNNLEVKYEQ